MLAPGDLLLHRVTKAGNGRLFGHRRGLLQLMPAAYQITPKATAFSDVP
jgi:hypothetical protein